MKTCFCRNENSLQPKETEGVTIATHYPTDRSVLVLSHGSYARLLLIVTKLLLIVTNLLGLVVAGHVSLCVSARLGLVSATLTLILRLLHRLLLQLLQLLRLLLLLLVRRTYGLRYVRFVGSTIRDLIGEDVVRRLRLEFKQFSQLRR